MSGPPYDGNASKARHAMTVGIPTSGSSNGDGGDRVGGDICPPLPEHHIPVYCDSSNTGAIYGVGKLVGSMGFIMLVGAGKDTPNPRLG